MNSNIIEAALFDGVNVESFSIKVKKKNYKKIRLRLEKTKKQLINKLKDYKKAGLINSIYYPSNKKLQNHLNKIVFAKRKINKSIEFLKKIYK